MQQKTFHEQEYDGLINLTLTNLYTIGKKDKIIYLYDFNRKNKEHLYILQVAMLARDIFGFELRLGCSWINMFIINMKIRKHFKKIKRIRYSDEYKGVKVQDILELMRPDAIARLGNYFTFSDIYTQYYEGSLN